MPKLCCRSCQLCRLCHHHPTGRSNTTTTTTTNSSNGSSRRTNDHGESAPWQRQRRRRRRGRQRSSSREDELLNRSNNNNINDDNAHRQYHQSPNSNRSSHSNASSSSSHPDDDDDDGDDHYNDADDYYSRRVGDTLCQWHKHSLLLVAGLSESDLVYAQFQNRFSILPYCILLDHDHSLVILSIRGSLTLEDVMTDTLVQPKPLDAVGEQYGFDAKGEYCHAGILACFENLYQDLRHHGLLEQLLLEDYPTYQLRIVGHSLGAGTATLLSYVLKSKFPTLKVYGFAPPGCTLTWKLATNCLEWTTCFVLDNDIVPRLSVLALEHLRDEVLELLGRIKVPKYKVFETFLKGQDGRRGCLFGSVEGGTAANNNSALFHDDDLDDLTHVIQNILDDEPHDTLYYRQVQDFLRVQQNRKESRGENSSQRVLFFPPGRLIHLLKTGEEGGCSNLLSKCVSCCTSNSGFVYTPVYISNDDLDEIVVNATMGTDHFIHRICDELHKVATDYVDQGGSTLADLSHAHEIV